MQSDWVSQYTGQDDNMGQLYYNSQEIVYHYFKAKMLKHQPKGIFVHFP